MREFLSGVLVMGDLVAALFFLRFWRQSGDRLFLVFATSFALLALQRGLLSLVPEQHAAMLYAIRLLAFLLIMWAIWDKNRPQDAG